MRFNLESAVTLPIYYNVELKKTFTCVLKNSIAEVQFIPSNTAAKSKT